MRNNTAFKFAPVFSDERKIDVTLEDNRALIKMSTWEGDLGWCGQKTISVDSAMLDELHRVITAARLKIKRDAADAGEENSASKILDFPKFA